MLLTLVRKAFLTLSFNYLRRLSILLFPTRCHITAIPGLPALWLRNVHTLNYCKNYFIDNHNFLLLLTHFPEFTRSELMFKTPSKWVGSIFSLYLFEHYYILHHFMNLLYVISYWFLDFARNNSNVTLPAVFFDLLSFTNASLKTKLWCFKNLPSDGIQATPVMSIYTLRAVHKFFAMYRI